MKRLDKQRPRMQVCLTDEMKSKIEDLANADGRSVSGWISRVIEREVSNAFRDGEGPWEILDGYEDRDSIDPDFVIQIGGPLDGGLFFYVGNSLEERRAGMRNAARICLALNKARLA